MAEPVTIPEDLVVTRDLRIGRNLSPPLTRSNLEQENLVAYPIPWEAWRVWDAYATNLPGTPATDDLGLVGGTFGTGSPSIQTGDLKAAGATIRYARCMLRLPPEYVAGETVTLRFKAGMLTTPADVSAMIDAEAYRSNGEAGIGSDLVTTAATTINSLTLGNRDFTVSPGTLSPGDWLDLRIQISVNDAATATAVIGIVGEAKFLMDIKG